jgi:hypothetical protein
MRYNLWLFVVICLLSSSVSAAGCPEGTRWRVRLTTSNGLKQYFNPGEKIPLPDSTARCLFGGVDRVISTKHKDNHLERAGLICAFSGGAKVTAFATSGALSTGALTYQPAFLMIEDKGDPGDSVLEVICERSF